MNQTETLGTTLPQEIERVQALIPLYESVGPAGQLAVLLMKADIKEAHRAMMEQDLRAMIRVYKSLKETTA